MLLQFHRAPFPAHFQPATEECPCSPGHVCQGYGAGRVGGSLPCSRSYLGAILGRGHHWAIKHLENVLSHPFSVAMVGRMPVENSCA